MPHEPSNQEVINTLTEFITEFVGESIQGLATHMDERFNAVDQRFERIEKEINQIKEEQREIKKEMQYFKKEQGEIKSVMATRQDLQGIVTKEYLEGRLAHIR